MTARVFGVGLTGSELTKLERELLATMTPWAVILFARNVESPDQLRALVGEIRASSPEPPLLLIDEEGGRVDRLRKLIPGLPGAEEIGRHPDARAMAGWWGRVAGLALRWFGIDVNLAPVVDVRREPQSKGLERRCWSGDAREVVELAQAFSEGQESQGVAGCVKHFPGIGATSADPHYGSSVVALDRSALEAVDFEPYRALAQRTGAVMIGHSIYPALDEGVPATLSRRISTTLLRDELGFTGLAVSDDMEMHAVADLDTSEGVAERALAAGSDVILYCSRIEEFPDLVRRIETRFKDDAGFAARVEEALRRGVTYRMHCARLRQQAPPAGAFDDVLAEAARFVAAFEGGGEGAQRATESGGTGRTGREEWT